MRINYVPLVKRSFNSISKYWECYNFVENFRISKTGANKIREKLTHRFNFKIQRKKKTKQNKMFLKNSVTMRFNTPIINIVSQISSANHLKVNKSTIFNSNRYQTIQVLYSSQSTNIQSVRSFSIFNQKSINVSLFITCLLKFVFMMS